MKQDCILFLFGDEWGEIDTVLPLIQSIKKKKKLRIIVLIKKDSTFQKRKKFSDLFKILSKNSDLILYPSYFSLKTIIKNEFFKITSIKDFKNLIMFFYKLIKREDYNVNPNLYKSEIQKKFNIKFFCNTAGTIIDFSWFNLGKNTKYLIVPHAPTFKGGKLHKFRTCDLKKHDENRKKKFEYYKNYPNSTKFFTSNNDEKLFFKKYCPKNLKLIPIGFTRLEKEWIDTIKKNKFKKKKKRQILILLGKTAYIGEQELKRKLHDIFYLAEKYHYSIKFKFHPKSIFSIKQLLKKFNDLKVEESFESVMSESLNSEVTISTSKTGSCLDSIAVGVPVIEYYSYGNGIEDNMQNEFKINGKIMSLFKYYNLVESIDSLNDLDLFFDKINSSKTFTKKIIDQQSQALKKISYNKNKVIKKFLQNF